MCEESVDKSPEALGALIALMMFLCCANTAKYKQQSQEPEKVPQKIENRQKVATNQFFKVSHPYHIIVR